MKKRSVALFLAGAMVFGISVGGTMAWLTAETEEVTNTFSIGDINIRLKEHDYITEDDVTGEIGAPTENQIGTLDQNKEVSANEDYLFVPGAVLPKDPFVTVVGDSEACYLFVRVDEKNNTYNGLSGDIIQWNVQREWEECTELAEGAEENDIHFYYKVIDSKVTEDTVHYILTNGQDPAVANQVYVNSGITKTMRDAQDGINAKKPQLIFTAAAVQLENLADSGNETADLAAAWGALSAEFKNIPN